MTFVLPMKSLGGAQSGIQKQIFFIDKQMII